MAEVDSVAEGIIGRQMVLLEEVRNALDGLEVQGDPTRHWIGRAENHITEALKDLRLLRDGRLALRDKKQNQADEIRRIYLKRGLAACGHVPTALIAMAGICISCNQDNLLRFQESRIPLCERCEERFERNRPGSAADCQSQVKRFMEAV